MRQNGHSPDDASAGLFSPRMYAIRCGVQSRSSWSGSPTPSCLRVCPSSMALDPRRASLTTIAGMRTALLRPGTAEDAAAVADLWHRGWHDAHPGHVPDGLTAGRTLAAFHERAPAAVAVTTVAEGDGAVAGFVMVVGDEVEQVYVDARHRGTDLAGLLLDEAERQVAAGGHEEAWLAV